MKHVDKRQIAGWIAVSLSIVITCFWAFWGIIENFHEGWYIGKGHAQGKIVIKDPASWKALK
jgi:hypothetical protein